MDHWNAMSAAFTHETVLRQKIDLTMPLISVYVAH